MGWEWILVQGDCTGCGICVDVCPHGALRMAREMAYPAPLPSTCTGCMLCVEECPFDAVKLWELAPS